MTASLRLLLPGDPLTATGGYRYDRRIVAALRDLGWHVEVVSLDDSFPSPTPAAHGATRAQLAAIPDGALTMIDGLALGAMPDEALAESQRLALIALVHHPLAAETGLSEARARVLRDSEARASYDAELFPNVYEARVLRHAPVSPGFQLNDEVRHPTDGIGRVVRIPWLQTGNVHMLVKFGTGIRKVRAEDVILISRSAPKASVDRPAQGESRSAASATLIPDVTHTRANRRRAWDGIEERRLDGSRSLRDDDRRTTDGRFDSGSMHDDYSDDADP